MHAPLFSRSARTTAHTAAEAWGGEVLVRVGASSVIPTDVKRAGG